MSLEVSEVEFDKEIKIKQTIQDFNSESKEIKISIGNANITIPSSETFLISSIVKELLAKC